jgi:glycosyltransferase involved in cell wall biosynthesis
MSWQSFLGFWAFIRFLRKESVDIVQTYFHDSTVFGVVAAKIAGVPLIISCRRDLGFWYGEKVPRFLMFANRFSDRFLANSESVRKILVEREGVSPAEVEVIPNGIDSIALANAKTVSLFQEYPQIADGDKVVGIVANFNRRVKRLDLFLESAVRVAAKFQKVKFLIIGGGNLENDLKCMARSLGIEDRVIFAGPKEPAIGYIRCFDIGVLCSDSEGFSNSLIEYMAAGKPVVATKVGGNDELVEDGVTGVLVPPGDPDALASALLILLNNEAAYKRMGEEGRRVVQEKFDWNVIIRRQESYYLSLVN